MMLGAMMWLSNCYHMLFLLDKVTRPREDNIMMIMMMMVVVVMMVMKTK